LSISDYEEEEENLDLLLNNDSVIEVTSKLKKINENYYSS
jgi:hypothetical protein